MFATLYLPDFYLQAAMRHHPKLRAQPVALIDPTQKKVAIIELNDAAEQAGVVKGMTPSQALARCLQVVIRTRERAQEKLIGEILLQHAFMLSPFVEATVDKRVYDNTYDVNGYRRSSTGTTVRFGGSFIGKAPFMKKRPSSGLLSLGVTSVQISFVGV